jgi:hypothetical protein
MRRPLVLPGLTMVQNRSMHPTISARQSDNFLLLRYLGSTVFSRTSLLQDWLRIPAVSKFVGKLAGARDRPVIVCGNRRMKDCSNQRFLA